MDNLENQVKNIFKENIDSQSNIDDANNDSDLTKFGLNSLNFVKILFGIENEFDIEIEDDEIDFDNFRTINKIISYIKLKNG